MSKEPADPRAKLTVEQAWEEALATLRAELTVEQAWEVALAAEAIWVAIRAFGAANARAEDAAAAGETVRAVMAARETAREAEKQTIAAAKRAIDAAGKPRVVLAMNANGPALRVLAVLEPPGNMLAIVVMGADGRLVTFWRAP